MQTRLRFSVAVAVHRPAAVALIPPLARELPYAAGALPPLKKKLIVLWESQKYVYLLRIMLFI